LKNCVAFSVAAAYLERIEYMDDSDDRFGSENPTE